jgi:hypothetical protein
MKDFYGLAFILGTAVVLMGLYMMGRSHGFEHGMAVKDLLVRQETLLDIARSLEEVEEDLTEEEILAWLYVMADNVEDAARED